MSAIERFDCNYYNNQYISLSLWSLFWQKCIFFSCWALQYFTSCVQNTWKIWIVKLLKNLLYNSGYGENIKKLFESLQLQLTALVKFFSLWSESEWNIKVFNRRYWCILLRRIVLVVSDFLQLIFCLCYLQAIMQVVSLHSV